MRIAIIHHERESTGGAEHAISLLGELWREEGHEVRHLAGPDASWEADVAILHVDASVVPPSYDHLRRRYPVVVNDRIRDTRKRRISRNLVSRYRRHDGPVLVKTDLNAAGQPERTLGQIGRLQRRSRRIFFEFAPDQHANPLKPYLTFPSLADVPPKLRFAPGLVIERFRPEREGDWYFVRRSFVFGDADISYRMGDKQPIIDAGVPDAFEWIDTPPTVLQVRRELGLDYGTIDFTEHDGETVVLDVNKTPGRAGPRTEAARADYDTILRTVARGLDDHLASS